LKDALLLVAARGQMMQALPKGTMLAVPLSEKEVTPLLDKHISLAAVNAPSLCVVSGQTDAIAALEKRLAQQHTESRCLHTTHAFHSDMTEPILETFANQVRRIRLNPPKIPYISNVTGTWINPSEATDPAYWAAHLRKTVRFSDGIRMLMRGTDQILLEAGPGRTLSTFAMGHQKKAGEQTVLTSLRHPRDKYSDTEFLLTSLGKLWLAGATPDWNGFHSHESRYRVPLPAYPFERQRYWIDPPAVRYSVSEQAESEKTAYRSRTSYTRPNISAAYADPRNETEGMIIKIFQELLGIEPIGIYDNFFDLGGHSLLATRGASRIREKFQLELSVSSLFEEPTAEGLARYIDHLLTLQKLQTPPDTELGDRTEGEI
jgi:acyl transferase domain-containing protein